MTAAAEPSDEDVPDDEAADDRMDTDEAAKLEQAALVFEEKADIESLLDRIRQLPPDTKARQLKEVICVAASRTATSR